MSTMRHLASPIAKSFSEALRIVDVANPALSTQGKKIGLQVYATASIASGVSFTVVRRNSRRSLRSKRRPRWMVARLSHITRSPTSHLCT